MDPMAAVNQKVAKEYADTVSDPFATLNKKIKDANDVFSKREQIAAQVFVAILQKSSPQDIKDFNAMAKSASLSVRLTDLLIDKLA